MSRQSGRTGTVCRKELFRKDKKRETGRPYNLDANALKRLQCIFALKRNVPWIDAPVFSAPGYEAGRSEQEVASSESR